MTLEGMNENLFKEVDQTIEALCKCIKGRTDHYASGKEISEMTNALAALVTARANVTIVKNRVN
jgi:hypothetical protein